jgi:hypothetical protein
VAKVLIMPKRHKPTGRSYRDQHGAELTAFHERNARWLELADAALSAAEKTIRALELARDEQQRIRKRIKTNIENYHRLEQQRITKKA